MKKNKKAKAADKPKDSKKKAGKKMFGGASKSLRKLGKRTGVSKLTTAQKVVGGAALAAIGLGLLAKRRADATNAADPADASAAEQNLAALDTEE